MKKEDVFSCCLMQSELHTLGIQSGVDKTRTAEHFYKHMITTAKS
jgi:hypothetical protein